MPLIRKLRIIRIFVASPGDVTAERAILGDVVNEVNQTLGILGHNTEIRLLRWETHTFPAAGRPQQKVFDQIGDYDVFIGIMWTRFGQPTGVADSGTKEEFDRAYAAWRKRGAPHMMFYFSTAPAVPARTAAELSQIRKVLAFRRELSDTQLVAEYDSLQKFTDAARRHLFRVVAHLSPLRAPISAFATRHTKAATVDIPSAGTRIGIIDIADDDAHFPHKETLVGRSGKVRTLSATGGGWYGGAVELEPDGPELSLFRFRWKRI